ncbi:hypothetical protein [Luteolibacter soli]|uniref:Type 4 secretion system PilS N-terminal domain-containing protein n=1 Tax=Luteolibacter soli TaxID=3135280 RepID=A0ABU9AW36_9BACT
MSSSGLPDMPSGADRARQDEPETRKFRLSKLEIVISVLLAVALVAVVAALYIMKSPAADRTSALSSLKVINLELTQFDQDYGRFPDTSTIASVRAATGTTIALGTRTSNDFFRQLVADGKTSEKLFWAPVLDNRRGPNDILGDNALAKGECIHSYVAGLSGNDEPETPIAMAPMIPGTTRFDPDPYNSQAVILRIDGSAMPVPIKTDTNEVRLNGKNLFDPSQPYWNGKAPDLKWPE